MASAERLNQFHYMVQKMRTKEGPGLSQATQKCVEKLGVKPDL